MIEITRSSARLSTRSSNWLNLVVTEFSARCGAMILFVRDCGLHLSSDCVTVCPLWTELGMTVCL